MLGLTFPLACGPCEQEVGQSSLRSAQCNGLLGGDGASYEVCLFMSRVAAPIVAK